MAVTASDTFQNRLKRWWRSLAAGLRKAKDVAPQVCVIGGAALGFILSVGSGSWLAILASTLLGFMLGVAVVIITMHLYEGLQTVLMRTAIFVGGVIVIATLFMALVN